MKNIEDCAIHTILEIVLTVWRRLYERLFVLIKKIFDMVVTTRSDGRILQPRR
jgi:hypothetical protein